MTKSILRLSLLSLMAAGIAGLWGRVQAQEHQKPNASEQPAAEGRARTSRAVPFHGKLKAVDPTAGTFSVGSLTVRVTAETRITKHGQPATLKDAEVGETVGGQYRKNDDGSLTATTVRFGPRVKVESSERKSTDATD
jgi:hypothetical protein